MYVSKYSCIYYVCTYVHTKLDVCVCVCVCEFFMSLVSKLDIEQFGVPVVLEN